VLGAVERCVRDEVLQVGSAAGELHARIVRAGCDIAANVGDEPLVADAEVDVDGFVDEVGFAGSLGSESSGEGGEVVADVCGVDGYCGVGGELVAQ
jgi:hypothetical protein